MDGEVITGARTYLHALRDVFGEAFVHKNTANKQVIKAHLDQKEVNSQALQTFFSQLPAGEWDWYLFVEHAEQLHELFGVSDEELKEVAVTPLSNQELLELKWEFTLQVLREYKKFSAEFYDALKYNNNTHLSREELHLLTELMTTFKHIKEWSSSIKESYENKKPRKQLLAELNTQRIPIEFLLLRILYIFTRETTPKQADTYADLLARERIGLVYTKTSALAQS